MICDDCGKKEAVVHIVQIGPNGRVEKNLCEDCAQKYGNTMFAPQERAMSVNDFLKGVFSNTPRPREEDTPEAEELGWPNCGIPADCNAGLSATSARSFAPGRETSPQPMALSSFTTSS